MSGIQTVPLRIPDVWDASWFRVFVAEVIAKADVRNAIGEGVVITSDGNSVATLSVDAETLGALTAHDGDPNAHANVIALHTSNSDPHTQYLTRTDFEAEMAQQYAIQYDQDADPPTVAYLGQALPGASSGAASWRIQKLTFGGDGDVSSQWADGDSNFDNVWTDRASLSYS